MRSALRNPTYFQRRRTTSLQRRYLQARTTDRPHVVKHEQSLQNELCKWFKQVLPNVHLRSDTGSGAFNSDYLKEQHNRQQSHKDEPDVMIFAARHGYHGLLIELKAECTCNVKTKHKDCALRAQRDGRKIRVYKDKKGRIIERDYKIRLKGDWKNLHVERQAQNLLDYEQNWGFCARFAIGLEHAKKLICWYFDLPYEKNEELPF